MRRELEGQTRFDTDMDAWIGSLKQWGINSWSQYAPHYRGYETLTPDGPRGLNMTSIGFMQDLLPEFGAAISPSETFLQEKQIEAGYEACLKHDLDFHLGFPFPLFPIQATEDIAKFAPEYLDADGRVDLYSDKMPELLKRTCRIYKERFPELKRFEMWVCEGCGAVIKVSKEELKNNEAWLPPLLQAYAEVTKELGVEGMIFAHDYYHTDATRKLFYDIVARFPDILIEEDLTWPEENMHMPFMGYIPEAQRRDIFRNSRITLNCLVDTDQGQLPCMAPRWWKYAVNEARDAGVEEILGRCGHWDSGKTYYNGWDLGKFKSGRRPVPRLTMTLTPSNSAILLDNSYYGSPSMLYAWMNTNNHTIDQITALGENVYYADGHAAWLGDPVNAGLPGFNSNSGGYIYW